MVCRTNVELPIITVNCLSMRYYFIQFKNESCSQPIVIVKNVKKNVVIYLVRDGTDIQACHGSTSL